MKLVKFAIHEHTDHETLLLKEMEKFESEGYRIIRLDNNITPDAIAIKDGIIVSIEVDTTKAGHNRSVKKYENDGQYDKVIFKTGLVGKIIQEGKDLTPSRYRAVLTKSHYNRVLELRREGMTYKQIKSLIKEECDTEISLPTIQKWASRDYVPNYAKKAVQQ